MMLSSELALEFEGKVFRIVDCNGDPWFVLPDLCKSLSLKNPAYVAGGLDPEDRADIVLNYTSSQRRRVIIVSEPGAMQIIMRSDAAIKPGTFAYRFRRWVTHEVLPSVRKHGCYPPPMPDDALALLPAEAEPIPKTSQERFAQELERYERRSGFSATTLPGLSAHRLRAFALGASIEKALGRGDLWKSLLSAGFDLDYILWKKRSRVEQAGAAAARELVITGR